MTFEIYKDKAGEFRVRMKGDNGEKLFDGYKNKKDALHTIDTVMHQADTAAVYTVDKAGRKKRLHTTSRTNL